VVPRPSPPSPGLPGGGQLLSLVGIDLLDIPLWMVGVGLSLDESMHTIEGRFEFLQFMPNKPTKPLPPN